MKTTIFCLIIILVLSVNVNADIIVEGEHYVSECVSIDNMGQFPKYGFVAQIKGPLADKEKHFVIKEGECINAGYKFNRIHIYAVKKSYLLLKGIENIDFDEDKNVFRYEEGIMTTSTLPDSDPVRDRQKHFLVKSISDNELKMDWSYQEWNHHVTPMPIHKNIMLYLIAFFTTFFIEFGILFLCLRKEFVFGNILALSFVVNFLTNPLANFIMTFASNNWLLYFFVLEFCVWFVESFLIYWLLKKKLSLGKAVLCSFIANFATALLSFVPLIF